MNKLLSFNHVKKVLLASSILMAPNLAFSTEIYEDQTELTDEQFIQLQALSDLANQDGYSAYSIESRSKKGSDAIMGEWNISYNYKSPKQDKIVLDSAKKDKDGDIYSLGSYYPNQTGAKQGFFCIDIDQLYTCLAGDSTSSNYIGFQFSISGNTINNGYFATASSIEGLFDGFKSKQYPISGSRGTGTQEPTQPGQKPAVTGSEASYDDNNNELIIPVLNYNGTKYHVILQGEQTFGKTVFSVKESRSIK